MTAHAMVALLVVVILTASFLVTTAPVQQEQEVATSLRLWVGAIEDYVSEHCGATQTDQTAVTLIGSGFVSFGAAWTYKVADKKTYVTADVNLSQHATISAKNAQALLTTLAYAQWSPDGTSVMFSHQFLTPNTTNSALYLPILMYHNQQGGCA